MARAFYITHPQVVIDPAVPVGDWRLTSIGAARVAELAARMPQRPMHVVASAERKALETAWPLAAKAGRALEVRPLMHENDRSATGFLPGPAFEKMADAFFARPDDAVRGWEPASAAQARILAEVKAVMQAQPDRELVFCGHGAVGTLLYCALAGQEISRRWDQAGGGHWYAFDTDTLVPEDHWQPLEQLWR